MRKSQTSTSPLRFIWVWSGKRTGSTLCFNIVRELLSVVGADFRAGRSGNVPTDSQTVSVVKCHGENCADSIAATPSGTSLVIISVREPRYQLASLERVFHGDQARIAGALDESVEVAAKAIQMRERLNVLLIHYSTPLFTKIVCVANALGVSISTVGIVRIMTRLLPLRQRLLIRNKFTRRDKFRTAEDPVTLLHPNHLAPIGDRRMATLTSKFQEKLSRLEKLQTELLSGTRV